VKETFTETELEAAISGLNLPTWSRSYQRCDSPQSEVTCAQVVHAWRTLNGWSISQRSPFSTHHHFLVLHAFDGVGNRMSTEVATFVIALLHNLTYTVRGRFPTQTGQWANGQAFDFHPSVSVVGLSNISEIDEYFEPETVGFRLNSFDEWYSYDFDNLVSTHETLYFDMLLYATMPYTNPQLASFCYEHFGTHLVYFVSNFLMTFPSEAMEQAHLVFDTIPANVRAFGVHIRFHKAGQYFTYTIERTFEVIKPFLKYEFQSQPTIFAFASDSSVAEGLIQHEFPGGVIKTSAYRRSDGDHRSALYDMALLEMCDERLLTYRSTFSYQSMARVGKRAWFVDKETPDVFQISNSQATSISMLYHDFDFNDWQCARRFRVGYREENYFRRYFKYFVL
jgi:hypothetical protein